MAKPVKNLITVLFRYVKELLNLLVTGKIISYDKEREHYYIPEDRKQYLVTTGK